jgi:hypothetical protein
VILPLGTGPLASGDDGGALPPPTGSATLPVRVAVGASGGEALPLRVTVVPAAIAGGAETVTDGGTSAAIWCLVVEIDGVDVSDSVVGEVTVEAEEGAARIADLALHQPSGTVISPAGWTGRSVRIWLADMSSGTPSSLLPLFSGIVDLPTVKPRSGLIALRCTDNRQGIIGGLTKAAIDSMLTGSRYSPVIFDAGASNWAYANDCLSTLPASLDLSPTGSLRLTSWEAKTTADLSFDEDQILEESVSIDIAERGSLTNQVSVNFGYRFPRIKAEGYLVSLDVMALNFTSFVYWVRDGNMFLQRAAVEAAIERAGGNIVSIEYLALPTTAQVIPGTGGAPAGAWLPNPLVDLQYCLGFGAVVSFDYAQQTEETHEITVANAASIAAVGVVRDALSGALEGVYDDTVAVEQNILLYRQKITTIPPKNLAPVVVGLTNSVTGTLTTDTDRDAANAAMETLVASAEVRIFASHRQHSARASIACNPVLDVDKTVQIDAQGVLAKGKVRRVVHRLDPDTARAVSEFELAICSVAGVGITHPADTIAAPAGTEEGTSNTLPPPTVVWNGMNGQDGVITITFPGVEETERARAAHVITSSFAAPLVEDVFEVTL